MMLLGVPAAELIRVFPPARPTAARSGGDQLKNLFKLLPERVGSGYLSLGVAEGEELAANGLLSWSAQNSTWASDWGPTVSLKTPGNIIRDPPRPHFRRWKKGPSREARTSPCVGGGKGLTDQPPRHTVTVSTISKALAKNPAIRETPIEVTKLTSLFARIRKYSNRILQSTVSRQSMDPIWPASVVRHNR